MKIKIVVRGLLLFLSTASIAHATGEVVTFKGISKTEQEFQLRGILHKPKGQGPSPAIIMLPPGGGFRWSGYDRWVDKFVNWGYVALKVETLASRGVSSIFEGDTGGASPAVSKEEEAQDAYAAKAYLSGLAFVDKNRIGLSGWGFGGGAVLRVVDPSVRLQNRGTPFKAAIAFYPMCDRPLMDFDTPLLVLNGESDTWHPATRCRVIEARCKHEIIMKTYPGAYMFFDLEGVDDTMMGHRLLYDPEAAADASEQVKSFLAEYFQ